MPDESSSIAETLLSPDEAEEIGRLAQEAINRSIPQTKPRAATAEAHPADRFIPESGSIIPPTIVDLNAGTTAPSSEAPPQDSMRGGDVKPSSPAPVAQTSAENAIRPAGHVDGENPAAHNAATHPNWTSPFAPTSTPGYIPDDITQGDKEAFFQAFIHNSPLQLKIAVRLGATGKSLNCIVRDLDDDLSTLIRKAASQEVEEEKAMAFPRSELVVIQRYCTALQVVDVEGGEPWPEFRCKKDDLRYVREFVRERMSRMSAPYQAALVSAVIRFEAKRSVMLSRIYDDSFWAAPGS